MATRLLLADDSITIQKVVELVLAEEGFEIKAAANGEEALRAMDSFMPDIVLADIEMPRMNGYQLCEKIKSNPATSSIPVLLLAGAFEPVDEELAQKVGAEDYIIKPFESQDLITKISAVLQAATAGPAQGEEEVIAFAEEESSAQAEPGADLWSIEGISAQAEEIAEAAQAEPEEIFAIAEEETAADPFSGKGLPAGAGAEAAHDIPQAGPSASAQETGFPAVTSAEVKKAIQVSISQGISDAFRGVNVNEMITNAILPGIKVELKNSIEAIVNRSAPQIIDSVVREVAREIAAGLKKDVERIIWETVPDLAETAVRKEIEAIKSEL